MPGIYVLKGVVKHYDWGGNSFIPALLQVPNTPGKPFAEYWLGIHPLGTALVDTGGSTGTELSVLTPNLPFLLKILDVKEMLSIQVHPDKQTAAEQFAAEEAAGIPADAGNRNYKDPNHKPELSVALGDFWLLHGFKSREGIIDSLQQVSGLEELLPVFQEKSRIDHHDNCKVANPVRLDLIQGCFQHTCHLCLKSKGHLYKIVYFLVSHNMKLCIIQYS